MGKALQVVGLAQQGLDASGFGGVREAHLLDGQPAILDKASHVGLEALPSAQGQPRVMDASPQWTSVFCENTHALPGSDLWNRSGALIRLPPPQGQTIQYGIMSFF
jgi:hypothetical protein